jgi:small subunit ribosomal protein S4
MGRNLRPTCKTCRRLGESVCGKVNCAVKRRPYVPGQHGPKQGNRARLTEYGIQLREKQKAKAFYGLLEKQFSNYYKEASKAQGNTSDKFIELLEQRLDNVVYRAGFADTRRQARQMVTHGHFLVNGRRCDIPSRQVRVGDVIELRPKSKVSKLFTERQMTDSQATWLHIDKSNHSVKVQGVPTKEDFEQSVAMNLIVEFYSR